MDFSEILNILHFKRQIILQGPPGTGKTWLSEKIAARLTEAGGETKVIQFHPSYSYEDFVRGISADVNEGQVEYNVRNRVLAEFAQKAQHNFLNHRKDTKALGREVWVRKIFEQFKEEVLAEVEHQNGFALTPFVTIVSVEDNAFRYMGMWKSSQRMKYNDIIELYLNEVVERQDIVNYPGISGLARTHATYFKQVLDKFREFAAQRPFQQQEVAREELKNFVLVIDEINRANLSSVLGELIYALEYRGKALDSIYELEGDREITLPPNLFIIGTMNTADRSIGHIDYAVRRRFAFVHVPPSEGVIREVIADEQVRASALRLYEKASALFGDAFLSPGFEAADVRLGHSYFLAQTHEELRMKLEYEIKPLLLEYLKDGILQGEGVREKIENLS